MTRPGPIRITRTAGFGRAQFRALGTGVSVLVIDPTQAAGAALEVQNELAAIDAACSRFRSDSELEVANRAHGHQVAVGPLLAEAVDVALNAARVTGGAVDPTVGASLRSIGYDRDFQEVVAGEGSFTFEKVRGWKSVRFNRRWGTLQLPPGVRLDLGATAKALAADRAAARAAVATGAGVLVSIGGDIATGGAPPAGGWNVRIADHHAASPSGPGPVVRIDAGGLATSSTTVRRWRRQGTELHHIVDPATGRPAEVVWRTVTVAASSCVDANTASTAAIVRGEGAPQWLASLGLTARLVRPDGSVELVGGWPATAVAA